MFIGMYAGGNLLIDLSRSGERITLATNEHGYATLTATVRRTLWQAVEWLGRAGALEVVAWQNGVTCWQGRVEDVRMDGETVSITAYGYQRALADVPYTALWSTKLYAPWRLLTAEDRSNTRTEKFEADNNNRIYLSPKKNEAYTTSTIGRLGMTLPDGGERYAAHVSFSYEVYLPSGWVAALISLSGGMAGSATIEWSVTGNDTSLTGTGAVTLTNASADALIFQVRPAALTYTGETGDRFLKITNLRIKTTASATVEADEIAAALAVFVSGINAEMLDAGAALIESPGLDLVEAEWADAYPADILTGLMRLGDDQSPPRAWEWGVWDDKRLHVRPRGSAGRAWYVDAAGVVVERTLQTLLNSAYGIYQDALSATQRTAVDTDADSVTQYGLTRRQAVPVQTTSSSTAEVMRDAALADNATPKPRSAITFEALYDAAGARWPLWMCRSGDTITIRNMSPTLAAGEVDRIRTFRVSESRYLVDDDRLEITPESPLPRLEVLVARQ